jgi:hypothetical protein
LLIIVIDTVAAIMMDWLFSFSSNLEFLIPIHQPNIKD